MKSRIALETRIGSELAKFSRYLWKQRIVHRVFDTPDGRQVLVVAQEQDVDTVRAAFTRWQRGELQLDEVVQRQDEGASPGVLRNGRWRRQPLTILAVVLSIIGTLLVYLDHDLYLLRWLGFTAFHPGPDGGLVFDTVAATYARGEYWRLLTPIFLHFGLLHLVFNMLWLWELGRRIETTLGSLVLLAIVVLTGAGGNIAQHLYDGTVLFGGMSGVIYGLLGYMWVWARLKARPPLVLPPGIMLVMMLWLLACMSGLVESLGFGAIANAAHLGGLVLGALLGLGTALLYSRPSAGAGEGK